MFDTILRGGTVIDGTGRPAFPADAAVIIGLKTLRLKKCQKHAAF